MPQLRERREDIPALAQHFLRKYSKELGSQATTLSPEAQDILDQHHWPGNVRELENVIERSLVLCTGERLEAADIKLDNRAALRPEDPDSFLPEGKTLQEHEQDLIRRALEIANGNKSRAARLLGLTRNALRYRLSQMGIGSEDQD